VPPKLVQHYDAIQSKLKAEPDLTLAELRAWLLAITPGLDQSAWPVEDCAGLT